MERIYQAVRQLHGSNTTYVPCPACGDGNATVTLDQKAGKLTVDCPRCEADAEYPWPPENEKKGRAESSPAQS